MLESIADYRAEVALEDALVLRARTIQGNAQPQLEGQQWEREAPSVEYAGDEIQYLVSPGEQGGPLMPGSELTASSPTTQGMPGAYLSQLEALSQSFGRLGDPYLLQVVQLIDPVLRETFLEMNQPPAGSVLTRLTAGQRAVIEAVLATGRITLGAVEVWLIGLRRCLAAGDASAIRWARATFQRYIGRWPGESDLTIERLSQRGFVRFVQETREARNLLAHGPASIEVDVYSKFCDSAYGTACFADWWSEGTNPQRHRPKNVGWIGLILSARKS